MPNNRCLINDRDLVRPAQLLDKGLPLPFLSGKYTVDEGWCTVITEGGAFREILRPGTHFLGKYSMGRDVKAIEVDMRLKTLSVETTREFQTRLPLPVDINLNLAVEYRVCDPRRVALEISAPLISLYDRVLTAVREVANNSTVDEIRTQGEDIAKNVLHRLKEMSLPQDIGIEVYKVLVTTIKATDPGGDALALQLMEEFKTIRNWQVNAAITQQTRITREWLIVNCPSVYREILAGNQALVKTMIEMGVFRPESVINLPPGATPTDMIGWLVNILNGQVDITPPVPPTIGPGPSREQLPPPSGMSERILEEIELLGKLPGAKAQPHDNKDGTFHIQVDMPRSSGGRIRLLFHCPAGFPQQPPQVEVEIDGQSEQFNSAVVRDWQRKKYYLVEIAREVKQWCG